MSVIIYAESINGKFKKTAYEICNYGARLAELLGTQCMALTNAGDEASDLAQYGVSEIRQFNFDRLYDTKALSAIISGFAQENNAQAVILADDSRSKAILGRLAVKLDAAVLSSVVSLPSSADNFVVKKSVFSAKAVAEFKLEAPVKVLSIARNSLGITETPVDANVQSIEISTPSASVQLVELNRVQGTVPLPEAELVVSAGRGMKSPENWQIIEDLADTLGATTACSRPVSDSGWRPHHEHVGQTGIAIKPNLYIAVGISGAIQHLAGVNNSKTIVVINKDPEAPFFKAADYGVVADLFDVVPRLNEALKKFKSA